MAAAPFGPDVYAAPGTEGYTKYGRTVLEKLSRLREDLHLPSMKRTLQPAPGVTVYVHASEAGDQIYIFGGSRCAHATLHQAAGRTKLGMWNADGTQSGISRYLNTDRVGPVFSEVKIDKTGDAAIVRSAPVSPQVTLVSTPSADIPAQFTLTFSGVSGNVEGVIVNGTNVLPATIAFDPVTLTTLSAVVAAIAASINTNTRSCLVASAAGSVLTLTAITGLGVVPNGWVLSSQGTTITSVAAQTVSGVNATVELGWQTSVQYIDSFNIGPSGTHTVTTNYPTYAAVVAALTAGVSVPAAIGSVTLPGGALVWGKATSATAFINGETTTRSIGIDLTMASDQTVGGPAVMHSTGVALPLDPFSGLPLQTTGTLPTGQPVYASYATPPQVLEVEKWSAKGKLTSRASMPLASAGETSSQSAFTTLVGLLTHISSDGSKAVGSFRKPYVSIQLGTALTTYNFGYWILSGTTLIEWLDATLGVSQASSQTFPSIIEGTPKLDKYALAYYSPGTPGTQTLLVLDNVNGRRRVVGNSTGVFGFSLMVAPNGMVVTPYAVQTGGLLVVQVDIDGVVLGLTTEIDTGANEGVVARVTSAESMISDDGAVYMFAANTATNGVCTYVVDHGALQIIPGATPLCVSGDGLSYATLAAHVITVHRGGADWVVAALDVSGLLPGTGNTFYTRQLGDDGTHAQILSAAATFAGTPFNGFAAPTAAVAFDDLVAGLPLLAYDTKLFARGT